MIERALPEPAATLLREVLPVLREFLDLDEFVIGGGTALAARWQHRTSMDVDLFAEPGDATLAPSRSYKEMQQRIRERCDGLAGFRANRDHGEIVLARPAAGIVEWSATLRQTPRPAREEIEPASGMQLDAPEEILAQKLYSRMLLRGGRHVRDLYDLAWAVEREPPEILGPALAAVQPEHRPTLLSVVGEMRDGSIPIDFSRPIEAPADPALQDRAAGVLHAFLESAWSDKGLGRGAWER